ncbi:uncharacterized protein EV154DRAFT_469876 [Mucor mucedo]|uniref:uncharacterized protein n=1 Tax=Mucor mucedo TaxID=29922 RepID=UPI00221F5AD5|nr:uncharacterized protein EV154DRAFT_469876 [Mucor mucedo]KAI7887853.1 hypothetical protein EV154DRAFT_469876 [Mucor mucedo]
MNNMVRIKIRKTVLAGTSFASLLHNEGYNNIVGFKVDIRILIDYKDEEFDLLCGDACDYDADKTKLLTEASKVMREGKEIQRNLAHNFYDEQVIGNVWIIQTKGAKCTFPTIHPTPHHYFVRVHLFNLHFPLRYVFTQFE